MLQKLGATLRLIRAMLYAQLKVRKERNRKN